MNATRAFIVFTLVAICALGVFAQSKFLRKYSLTQTTGDASTLPPSNSISLINTQDSTLWIGTSKGAAKSTNYGTSWKSYQSNPAFANDGIYALATRGDTVWTSTGYDKEITDGTIQTGSGFAFSTNAGLTWQHMSQPLDRRGDSIISYNNGINDSVYILPVTVLEANVTYDIALSPGTVWIASWSSGLRKRTYTDSAWQRILLPPDNRSSLSPTDTLWSYAPKDTLRQRRIFQRFNPVPEDNLKAFAVCAVGSDTIWCGTAGGVNKSTDGGVSWTRITHHNQLSSIMGDWVIAVREQRYANVSRIWTTNWTKPNTDDEYGVSYTDDGGATWKNLLNGIKAYDFAFKDSIAYIATDNGVYRTPDGGLSFTRVSYMADPDIRQAITSPAVFSVSVLADTVFVGTGDGLASTIDNDTHNFGSAWKIYRAYQQVGSSNLTYAYPNPFSPSSEIVRIHYGSQNSSGNSQVSVSIDIFDFGMNRVRTLINNVTRSGSEFDEIWDGRDDHGRLVANGTYFYRLRLENQDPQFGKILVLQ